MLRINYSKIDVMIKRYLDYSLRQCHYYGYRKRKNDMSLGLEKRLSHQSEKDMAKAMRRMKAKRKIRDLCQKEKVNLEE